ncbi:hypothetical protein AAH978_16975 [Streptomyces sp. ZYX-F-203]
MLPLRLTLGARWGAHLRKLSVAAASAGTGFLLLSTLGHALGNPGTPGASALRLAWCAAPLAATVQFAVAVARADAGDRRRTGASALGSRPDGPAAISATATAVSCVLGSLSALALFVHLSGDTPGVYLDDPAPGGITGGQALPMPAALTLLALVPLISTVAVALSPRATASLPRRADGGDRGGPGGHRRHGRFGAYGLASRETFGAYGRFGARRPAPGSRVGASTAEPPAPEGRSAPATRSADATSASSESAPPVSVSDRGQDLDRGAVDRPPGSLPWGAALVAAGIAVESQGGAASGVPDTPAAGVLAGWALTAVGLALAGPGLTHLCGRLLSAGRPGAMRLLAGRGLTEEAARIGRPLGVVCAVASAGFAAAAWYGADGPRFGPLSTLGASLVAGCAMASLLTAAVEAKHARAGSTEALLRLGAPPGVLRGSVALRAAALAAVFGPLTLVVADLAAGPLAGR